MKNRILASSLALTIIALVFTIGSLFITQVVLGAIANLVYGTTSYAETPTFYFIFAYTIAILAMLFSYALFVTWLEKREVTELSLVGAGKEFGMGAGIGGGIIIVVVLFLFLLGYYKVESVGILQVLVRPFFSALFAGAAGEVIFRVILFRFVEKSWGSLVALSISALLFGFLHMGNPNATFVGGLAISVGAGLLLGGAYMWTRRHWLVMGIHAGWNFTLGAFFGLPVSGNESVGFYVPHVSGPTLLTGGDFVPEASLITLIVGLAAGIAIIRKAQEAGQFISPSWKRN